MKGASGIFAGRHGFAFPVFMVSFVLEMASFIDFYLCYYNSRRIANTPVVLKFLTDEGVDK